MGWSDGTVGSELVIRQWSLVSGHWGFVAGAGARGVNGQFPIFNFQSMLEFSTLKWVRWGALLDGWRRLGLAGVWI